MQQKAEDPRCERHSYGNEESQRRDVNRLVCVSLSRTLTQRNLRQLALTLSLPAMLAAPSLRKRSIKVPNLKPPSVVVFGPLRASAPKRISIKMHSFESEICYRTIKYIICRPCMCAEILQAAAVKGLKTQQLERGPRGVCFNSRVDVLASCVQADCV